MTDIVKGMAIAGWHKGNPALQNHLQCFPETQAEEEAKMRAAFLWQAENASEEIARHLCRTVHHLPADEPIPAPMLDAMTWRVAAAIRAAAGEEGK